MRTMQNILSDILSSRKKKFRISRIAMLISPFYRKAMSMPHGGSSPADSNDKLMHDVRKQIFPDKVDWTVQSVNGAHIWLNTEQSGCFVSQDCKVRGQVFP